MGSESLGVMANLFFIKPLSGGLGKNIVLSVLWWLFQTVKHQEERLMLLLQGETGCGPLNYSICADAAC